MSDLSEYQEVLGDFNADQRAVIAKLISEIRNDAAIRDRNVYRSAAQRLTRVLYVIDEIMAHSRAPVRDWQQISLALGLPSCRYLQLTEAAIGRRFDVGRRAVGKSITKLMRLAEIKPNSHGYNGQL